MGCINMLSGVTTFFNIMDSINMIIIILSFIIYMGLNISSVLSLFIKPKKYPLASHNHKYAILISARNEEKVIGQLIDSIHKQNYPQELLDIYVVADNCTDNTYKVAKEAGAIVYQRHNVVNKGKSYALEFLIEKIYQEHKDGNYEAFFIFDADNLLHPNYIKEMNKAYDSGVKICTGFRDSKNFSTNWISANASMMFYMECCISHQFKTLMDIGTYVGGTGYYVDAEIIKQNGGWIHHSMVEDIEFSIDSSLKGYKVMYCADAIFYDEQPVTFKDSFFQRLRWSKGTHQCFHKYEGKLLWKGLSGKSKFTCLELAKHLSPLPIVGLLWQIIYAITTFTQGCVINHSPLIGLQLLFTKGFMMSYIVLISFLFYALVVLIRNYKRMDVNFFKKILYCLTYPIYMSGFLVTNVASLFMKVKWRAIPHSDNKTIEEVDMNAKS